MSDKNLIYYRMSRLYKQKEPERASEETVRASISAWLKNIDRAMARIKKGKKVATPYAYYIAKPIKYEIQKK